MAIITVALSVSAFERFKVERTMAEKREEREHELSREQARVEELKAEVEHLKDYRGIEEELRNRFDVAKEGERVVVIIDDDNASNSTEINTKESPEVEKSKKSFFEMFKFW